jgi:hypothetical protein
MDTLDISGLSELEKQFVRDLVTGKADVQTDSNGQVIIFTGLATLVEDGQVVEFNLDDTDRF